MTSNLSAFAYIPERAEATPALWNTPLSVLSANIAAVDQTLSLGQFQQLSIGSTPPSYLTTAAVTIAVNSSFSDYLYMVDSSAQRSSYLWGSHAGGTLDGLTLYDISGSTSIANFSKQSVKFYVPISANVFDTGGQLFNVVAYGAKGDGATDDTASVQLAISSATIGGTIYFPPGTYLISNTLLLSRSSIILSGTQGSTIKIKNNSTMSFSDSGATCAIAVEAANCTLDTLILDGNKANNTQILHFISCSGALGARDITLQNLEVKNVQGSAAYGGACQLRSNASRIFINNCNFHDNNSDGLNIFGASQVNIANFRAANNGIVGLDIEGSNIATTLVTVNGALFQNNAAEDVLVINSHEITLNGVVVSCGTVNPAENNTAVKFSSCSNCAFTNFVVIGPGAGVNPDGIALDDEGVVGRSQVNGVVIGPGIVTGMARDGIRFGRAGSIVGSTNVIINGVSSNANLGYGIRLIDSALDSNIQVMNCEFFNNALGAANGLDAVASRIVIGNYPNDGTYVPFQYLGTIASNLGNDWNVTGPMRAGTGTSLLPSFAYLSELSLGFYRSGVSTVGLSYGAFALPAGSSTTPSLGFSSETSLGLYRSGTSTIAHSYGSTLLAPNFGDRVGIGVAAPLDVVDIRGSGTGRNGIQLYNTTAGVANSARILMGADASGTAALVAEIFSSTHASFPNQAWLYAQGAAATLVLGSQGGERLRIQSAGSIVASQQFVAIDGSAINPSRAYTSETSLGFFRSGASVVRLSYGQLSVDSGSNTTPGIALSNKSVGWYQSGAQTIAQSLGTFNLATNAVRFSMRTLAASSVTASAANTNVARDEVVFTIGGASGASLIISSGGTAYIFNSAASAILA